MNGALGFCMSGACLALNFKMTALAAMQRADWRAEARRSVRSLLWPAGKDAEKLEHSYIVAGMKKWGNPVGNSSAVPQKVKHRV